MSRVILGRRSSRRAISVERERIARDLHDGVVQSLIATEMQLDLIRRLNGSAEAAPDAAETLAKVQHLIRVEVRKLRGQIEQLRASPPADRVLECVADMLLEFQHETGIVTTFACDVQESSIPRHLCRELLRIVEEALNNARRHSGARSVQVRLSSDGETLRVVIQDDGRGFGFTGRLALAQLEAARKGPQSIRERVRSNNGELVLDSDPSRGTRMEIQFASNHLENTGS